MKTLLNRIIREEEGQGMTEYGLILGFIAVAVIATMVIFKDEITGLFNDATAKLDTNFGE